MQRSLSELEDELEAQKDRVRALRAEGTGETVLTEEINKMLEMTQALMAARPATDDDDEALGWDDGAPDQVASLSIMGLMGEAAEEGKLDSVKDILDSGMVAVNDKTEEDETALHLSCLYGQTAVVTYLLDAGADVAVLDEDNSTPLHDASAGGFTEIVTALLSKGASVGAVDKDGDTPLHLAANGNEMDVVKLLLEVGADKRAVNLQGKEPKDLAETPDIVALLA